MTNQWATTDFSLEGKRTKGWLVGNQSKDNGALLFISVTLHTSSSKQISTDMTGVYTLTGLGV